MTAFADFYALYPRKKSRGDAEKAWKQALKAGHDPEEIMAGLKRNLADISKRDPQFIPYPATWLRSQAWADEPDTAPKPAQPAFTSVADRFPTPEAYRAYLHQKNTQALQ
jgi:hypothetical protein